MGKAQVVQPGRPLRRHGPRAGTAAPSESKANPRRQSSSCHLREFCSFVCGEGATAPLGGRSVWKSPPREAIGILHPTPRNTRDFGANRIRGDAGCLATWTQVLVKSFELLRHRPTFHRREVYKNTEAPCEHLPLLSDIRVKFPHLWCILFNFPLHQEGKDEEPCMINLVKICYRWNLIVNAWFLRTPLYRKSNFSQLPRSWEQPCAFLLLCYHSTLLTSKSHSAYFSAAASAAKVTS